MRKFLKSSLFLALIFAVVPFSRGVEKYDHYRHFFDSLGFRVYEEPLQDLTPLVYQDPLPEKEEEIPEELAENEEAEAENDEEKFQLEKGKYVLLFTSAEMPLDRPYDTLIVCDAPYEEDLFSCSPTSVRGEGTNTFFGLGTGEEIQLLETTIEGNKLFVIPQDNLLSPTFKEKTASYIKSLTAADHFRPSGKGATDRPVYTSVLDAWTWETFTYALVFMLLILLFKPLLFILVRSPQKLLKPATYRRFIEAAKEFFERSAWLSEYVLLVLTAFLIPISSIISYKDRGTLDVGYLVSFFADTLDPSSIVAYFKHFNTVRIAVFLYLFAFIVFSLLYFLPKFLDLFVFSLPKLFGKKESEVDAPFLKGALLTLTSLGLFLSLVVSPARSFSFVVLFLLFVLYFAYLLKTSEIEITTRERLVTLGVFTAVFVFSTAIRLYTVSRPMTYKYEELIGVSDEIVLLPYEKKHPENALFEPFVLEDFSYPLFVDDYLVYYPGAFRVETKPVSEFSAGGSYVILGTSEDTYREAVLSNSAVRAALGSESVSPYFFVENFPMEFGKSYSVRFSLDCSEPVRPSQVEYKVFYSEESADEEAELTREDIGVLEFPGCERGERLTYSLPFVFEYIPEGPVLFEFGGYSDGFLESLTAHEIFLEDRSISYDYLASADPYEVLAARIFGRPEEVTAYSFSVEEPRTFEIEVPFDLSAVVNELKKVGLLYSNTVLWSTESGIVIRNEYLE